MESPLFLKGRLPLALPPIPPFYFSFFPPLHSLLSFFCPFPSPEERGKTDPLCSHPRKGNTSSALMRLRRGSQNPRGATIYPVSLDLLSWEHVLQRAQNSGASPGPVTQQLWHGLDSGSGTTCLRGDVSARARGHVGTYLRGDVHARGHFLVGTDVPGHLSARPGVSERKRWAQSWGNRALSVGPGVAAAMTPAPCGSELCLSTAAEGGRGARSGALGPWSCVSPLRPWRGRRARVPRAQRLGAWSESAVRLVSELPVSSFQRQRARVCV